MNDGFRTANTRGAIFMVLAMAAFAVEDMLVKSVSQTLPIGMILIVFGAFGTVFFMSCARVKSQSLLHPAISGKAMIIRSVCEISARLFFTLSLALTPLSSTSAILQATPLVVMIGAVLFFAETVGYRRWIAAAVGFLGVLLIIKPGANSFEPASMFAVLATIGFAGRDLGTRAAPKSLSSIQLGVYGFIMLPIAGVLAAMWTDEWVIPSLREWLQLSIISFVGVAAYSALTAAMRNGEISFVAPFRYTRLIFALLSGVVVFSEVPDAFMLLGSTLIILSGLFSLNRARKLENETA
ncbi:MAG: drug/metabolite transporter (DMT)-like permease [Granulosicoccus sp.]